MDDVNEERILRSLEDLVEILNRKPTKTLQEKMNEEQTQRRFEVLAENISDLSKAVIDLRKTIDQMNKKRT